MSLRRRITPSSLLFNPVPATPSPHPNENLLSEKPLPSKPPHRIPDLWALLLLTLGILTLLISGLTFSILSSLKAATFLSYIDSHPSDLDCGFGSTPLSTLLKSPSLFRHEALLIIPILSLALLLSWLYILLLFLVQQNFALWTATIGGSVAAGAALCLFYFGNWQAGMLSSFFSVASLLCFFTWKETSKISGIIVAQAICETSMVYRGIFMVSGAAGLATLAMYFAFFCILGRMRSFWQTMDPACSTTKSRWVGLLLGVIFFLCLLVYWITQTISVLAQALASGPVRSWFLGARDGKDSYVLSHSIRQTFRFRLGSISLGSLMLSLAWILRDLSIAVMQIQFAGSNGSTSTLQTSVSPLLLALLLYLAPTPDMIQRVYNDWAFVLMEFDQLDYYTAMTRGGSFMFIRGLQALADESAIIKIFDYIPLAIGGTCAVTMYLILTILPGPIKDTNDVATADAVTAGSFLAGMQIARTVMAPFKGATVTTFVLMGREPQTFQSQHGDLWMALVEIRPRVAEGLLVYP
ncbi:PNS1 protein [Rutstroemia sp. NJR-2017a WRK4]|nr:PNS1 protein [Rutstroemia sp. NJR-2017a WRK4]